MSDQLNQKTSALAEISPDEMAANVARWNTTFAVLTRSLEEARKMSAERKNVLEGLTGSRGSLINKLLESDNELDHLAAKQNETRLQAKENDLKIASLQALIIPAENELEPVEVNLLKREKEEQGSGKC